ncbi:MAG TPA: undecaprenyldiphospho-muramoylpentapeptide beta-N-acetylglucosaminyltransferase [Actinomycetota bacterium]|nr:undecaprenyldiphospho-muramoylpentapeptide beta-N-acetylglucosaminyltransferase [Actinomycetota bacterium]
MDVPEEKVEWGHRSGLRVLLAGGGTTGHLSPGLAVAELLSARGAEILFIGTPNGPEARIVPKSGYPFKAVSVIGRGPGKITARNLQAVAKLGTATLKALGILRTFKPDVVVGTGGYVSLPAAFAAKACRVPLVLHEQNSVPGMANRVARRFAVAVGVSFPGTERFFGPGAVLVGNPVREALKTFDQEALRPRGLAEFELEDGRPTLLVFGGSQGAQSINEAVLGAYDGFRSSDLQILHLAGPRNADDVAKAVEEQRRKEDRLLYRVVGYTDSMELAYACSDLALCRSGASTVAELAAVGLPAILVPLPISLDDDQRKNAEAVVEAGGALMVLNAELNPQVVIEVVNSLISDATKLAAMAGGVRSLARPDAAERFAELVEGSAR